MVPNIRQRGWRVPSVLVLTALFLVAGLMACGEADRTSTPSTTPQTDFGEIAQLAKLPAACDVPSDPVDATHMWVTGEPFYVTLSGIGDGYTVTDGEYLAWCIEDNGRPNKQDGVLLFCSTDSPLPGNLGDVPWDKINYLLNHKQGTFQDVQAAIWYLTWGVVNLYPLTPTAQAMIDDANANGVGFVPSAGEIIAIILYTGDGGLGWENYQDVIIEVPLPRIECRVTGGGVDTFGNWDGTMAEGKNGDRSEINRYTFGGQAGAPTASQPQPYGEWTHHQQRGPDGSFVFHAGTASAPEGTEIDWIECSDPGWCVQARPAPAKQIDFEGVGTFKNIKDPSDPLMGVVPGETFHWFSVHIEDLGEPGKGGKIDPPGDLCPPEGSFGDLANCDCPDFYRITIHETDDPMSDVIYEVYGYLTGGNLQIHPAIK